MQEKHLKLVGVGWFHSQIRLVAVKDDGGELKEGKLCIQWKSKKKLNQSERYFKHLSFGVSNEHTV